LGTNGVLNRALEGIGLIDHPLTFLFYGYFAIVVTLVYVYLPVAILTIYGALQEIDERTLEASRDMGAGRFQTLARIVIPQARLGITAAFALTFILGASDYITPRLVGGASGQMVGSIIEDQFGGAANLPLGAALAFTLVASFAVVLALAALGARLIRVLAHHWPARALRRTTAMRRGGVAARVRGLSLSLPATALILLYLLAPLVTVVIFSFNHSPVPSLPLTGLTGHWYVDIVSQSEFPHALIASLITMAVAVGGGMLIGIPAAFALARRRFRTRSAVQAAVYVPVAVPGIVIGTALLTALTYLDIRLGLFPTALAHILLVAPYIVIVVRARLNAFDARIQEAGRDLGATPARVFRTITLPLIAPSLLGAALLAGAVSLDEILVTNFTIGANSTLPVWILSQIHRGITPAVNALAVMILGASVLLVVLAERAMRLRNPAPAMKELEALR
jgi:ABC-type spermidine/putrescine transport system permease subunit II